MSTTTSRKRRLMRVSGSSERVENGARIDMRIYVRELVVSGRMERDRRAKSAYLVR
jgi:hypothetical protein